MCLRLGFSRGGWGKWARVGRHGSNNSKALVGGHASPVEILPNLMRRNVEAEQQTRGAAEESRASLRAQLQEARRDGEEAERRHEAAVQEHKAVLEEREAALEERRTALVEHESLQRAVQELSAKAEEELRAASELEATLRSELQDFLAGSASAARSSEGPFYLGPAGMASGEVGLGAGDQGDLRVAMEMVRGHERAMSELHELAHADRARLRSRASHWEQDPPAPQTPVSDSLASSRATLSPEEVHEVSREVRDQLQRDLLGRFSPGPGSEPRWTPKKAPPREPRGNSRGESPDAEPGAAAPKTPDAPTPGRRILPSFGKSPGPQAAAPALRAAVSEARPTAAGSHTWYCGGDGDELLQTKPAHAPLPPHASGGQTAGLSQGPQYFDMGTPPGSARGPGPEHDLRCELDASAGGSGDSPRCPSPWRTPRWTGQPQQWMGAARSEGSSTRTVSPRTTPLLAPGRATVRIDIPLDAAGSTRSSGVNKPAVERRGQVPGSPRNEVTQAAKVRAVTTQVMPGNFPARRMSLTALALQSPAGSLPSARSDGAIPSAGVSTHAALAAALHIGLAASGEPVASSAPAPAQLRPATSRAVVGRSHGPAATAPCAETAVLRVPPARMPWGQGQLCLPLRPPLEAKANPLDPLDVSLGTALSEQDWRVLLLRGAALREGAGGRKPPEELLKEDPGSPKPSLDVCDAVDAYELSSSPAREVL